MNSETDQGLLRRYAEFRSEEAFASLTHRHIDMVYSVALRMVRDPHLAEDVTQGVFVALAKNVHQLTDCAVLSGWLHRTTHNLAANAVRSDVRRRHREQEAASMNELITQPEVVWDDIAPHLDNALSELSELDRDVLLLRYFERKSAREMAHALGISDEAAQKRVNRAVDRLREVFSRQGFAIGTGSLVALISTNVVQAAPVGLTSTISAAVALSATTVTSTVITTTKTVAMTTLQKTLIAVTLTVAVGTGIYQANRANALQKQLRHTEQPLAQQDEKVRQERDDAMKRLAILEQENELLRKQAAEVHKLRNDAGRLQNATRELAQLKSESGLNDPVVSEAVAWQERVKLLRQRFDQNPETRIPEFQFLTEVDWLNATRGKLQTDKDYRQAMSTLRNAAENKFVHQLQSALRKYMDAHNKEFPTSLSQLETYFASPVDNAILDRYAIIPADALGSLRMGGDWIITQKSPVDKEFDSRVGIGPNGYGSTGTNGWDDSLSKIMKTLDPVIKAYTAANGGKKLPADPTDLLPYLNTPEQKAAYEKAHSLLKSAREASDK